MSNGPPNLGNGTAIPLNTFQQNIANGNANNQTSAMNGSGPPNQVAPSSSGLRRALTERQINMIAFSGVVGTGIFLTTGHMIRDAGPGGALLGYAIGGLIYWSVIATLGEMTAVLPVEGILVEFPSRFLGSHVGFAVGWLYWACYAIVVPTQIVEISNIMEFAYDNNIRWRFTDAEKLPRTFWILFFWVLLLPINLIPIKIYGKIEAVVGYFKMLVLCGLIILMLIIADGNARRGQNRIGFSAAWNSTNGPFLNEFQLGARTISGPAGQFLLTLNVLSAALFSYVGMEIVAVAVGEAKYLDQAKSPESIKVGTRKIYIRVIVLYLASIIAMSFPVWSTNPNLKRDPRLHDGFEKSESATSPFLIAIIEAGIPILPHILNAFFVFSGFASAVNSLYVSSRILYSLAKRDMVWPKSFQKRLKVTCRMKSLQGIPSAAVGTGWIVALVSIVGIWQEPSEVFRKFSTNAVVSAQIVNCCICLSYIRYYRHLRQLENQVAPDKLRASNNLYAYKSHFQPVRAIFGFIGCAFVILTNGLPAMLKKPVDAGGIVASYISVFLFASLALFYALKEARSYKAGKIKDFEIQYRLPGSERRGDLPLDSSLGIKENIKAFGSWILVYL
ncbi:hypothetical protein EYR41_004652 [Orbilia oligospora]|uniref:Amino acid permease/ SLC12A domain-containing protein n=1 Tax=Orbilia oligospora TaxID=2813651 RepID=A0A8H2HY07_ORBOL|nr:hypothetical protein EYR41_004652 [Orbilia oligospora]